MTNSQARSFTIMQEDSANLFGFRQQALWKDTGETHGMNCKTESLRLFRSMIIFQFNFRLCPRAGRSSLSGFSALIRDTMIGEKPEATGATSQRLRLAICAATFWLKTRFKTGLRPACFCLENFAAVGCKSHGGRPCPMSTVSFTDHDSESTRSRFSGEIR